MYMPPQLLRKTYTSSMYMDVYASPITLKDIYIFYASPIYEVQHKRQGYKPTSKRRDIPHIWA
ncbi:hypothetical protein Syun_006986 [Stephania yunnanensis]|uniref:Uncharacterized protein n=1 Tax=Stephania yunnanensis TaxID=152371 RepID=A0AAP0PYZ9_9MAGN